MRTILEFINKGHINPIKRSIVVKTNFELREAINEKLKVYGKTANLNDIDTSKVVDFSGVFRGLDFNGDISKWRTENAVAMKEMFYGSTFDGDISKWDVSKVDDMRSMFEKSSFTGKKGDIGNWKTKSLVKIDGMFRESKFEGNLDNWDTGKLAEVSNAFTDIPDGVEPPDWYYEKMWG